MATHGISMKLVFKQAHESIKQFSPVELPDFSVITGLNGSGKTHLMRALKMGKIIADSIPVHEVGYYTYKDFLVPNSQTLNSQQIETQRTQTWQFFNGAQGTPKVNWRQNLVNLHNQHFVEVENNVQVNLLERDLPDGTSIWDVYRDPTIAEPKLSSKIQNYVTALKSQVFANPGFKKIPYHMSLIKALRKTGKNLHLVNEEDFQEKFVPSVQTENYLVSSLGVIFTKYKVNQYLWAHSQWDKGETSTTKAALYSEYEERHEKPWDVINQILTDIHEYAGGSAVFNFAITQPDDGGLKMDNWQSYSFTPFLIDKNDGTFRQFSLLSSGEQVLLALTISIYEARDDFSFPELLLLDEIDGSLHPSMTTALIETILNTFVKRGTKVVLATHSPSTVALAPDDSVFVVHKGAVNKKIEPCTNKLALSILTEGFATLNEIEPSLSIDYNLGKTSLPILFTEGITDKIIIEAAWSKLDPDIEMPFYIQDCFDASFLANLFRRGNDEQEGIFKKYADRIFIALFDFDFEGYNSWNGLKNLPKIVNDDPINCIHRSGLDQNSHALLLPVPDNEQIKRQVIKDGNSTYKNKSSLTIELLLYSEPALSHFFRVEKIQGGGEIIVFKGRKREFAEIVKSLPKESFGAFTPLFHKVTTIVAQQDSSV